MSLRKILWVCAGVVTLIMGIGSGIHWVLGVALFFIAALATARFIAAKSELAGGRVAIVVLAACVAVGFLFPLVLPLAYIGYVAWTWYSIASGDEGVAGAPGRSLV